MLTPKDGGPEQGIVKLCCGRKGCPSVDFTDPQAVVLKDDAGGQVKLTPEEWAFLKEKFAHKSA